MGSLLDFAPFLPVIGVLTKGGDRLRLNASFGLVSDESNPLKIYRVLNVSTVRPCRLGFRDEHCFGLVLSLASKPFVME